MHSVTYVANNDITLLESGSTYFPALLAAIESAKYEILYETYIYAEDPQAQAVTDALIAAAQRGVKVRVLADWFGTGNRIARAHLFGISRMAAQQRDLLAWDPRRHQRFRNREE